MKQILLLNFIFFFSYNLFGQTDDYVPGLVVVKFDQQQQRGGDIPFLSEDLLKTDERIQSLKQIESEQQSQQRGGQSGILAGIYKIDLTSDGTEKEYINYLKSFPNVQYAELYPNVKPLLVPNDPQAQIGSAQEYLAQIKAYQAWDITQGNNTKIIGIIDTGVDLDHEDLVGNLYLNVNDPIDGVDNDGDGYLDNYYGWDFADDDNMPEADGSPHGTGVAGIAAAATNNSRGMAGVGFNTKFMPIKIFRSSNNLSRNSFEAIIYAADMGCDVINLSWGNTGRFSQFAQDIINYAVIEKSAVIVAAAGNTNGELNFFPASYDNVLSVAYVNKDDVRDPNATYSDFIDLVAPGVNIYTTQNNNTYARDGGSSYAAPMVAGAAALVRALHPNWTAQQVMEQLRVNSDDIYAIGNNAEYLYKFGKGRLNVFKSIANFDKPAIRISKVNYSNGLEQAAYFGDTLSITLDFTNYLESTDNVEITLTSESTYVSIMNNSFTIPALATGETIQNSGAPFTVILSNELPENEAINFRVLMNGEFYTDYQAFQIQSSPKIQVFDFNGWRFGLTATGNIGRSKESPFSTNRLFYNNELLLENFGVAIVANQGSISDNLVYVPDAFQYSDDFITQERLKRYNDITADLDVRSVFQEKADLTPQLGIRIDQRILGWDGNGSEPFIILKYQLMNKGSQNYDSIYYQFLANWAINGESNNKIGYDADLKLSYAYNADENNFAGIALLGNYDSTFYALDFGAENGNTTDLESDTLTNNAIWEAVTNSFGKLSAGDAGTGNNIAGLQGIKLNNFNVGDQTELTLAILQAPSFEALKSLVDQAKLRNDSVKYFSPLGRQVFICENESPTVNSEEGTSFKVFDSAVSETIIYDGNSFKPGVLNQDSTFYYEIIDADGFSSIRKRMIFTLTKPKAYFELPEQPFLLTPEKNNSYRFLDLSEDAVAWQWTFSNGYQSTQKNPKISFNAAGSYEVTLIAESHIGCKDTITRIFETAWRGATPQIASVEICKNSQVALEDPALQEIVVYTDVNATNEVYRGPSFLTPNLVADTVYYIRNESTQFPSELVKVNVDLIPLQSLMTINTNLTTQSNSTIATASSLSKYAAQVKWVLGNEELGTNETVDIDLIDLLNKDLKLIAYSQSGCTDTLTFNDEPSQLPIFEDVYTCANQPITIKSENATSIFFFADEALSNFLGKGAQIIIENITSDSAVYAVNVQDIMPSEPVRVPIYISEVDASFTMNTDTLNLAFENSINFEGNSTTVSNWEWNFGGSQTFEGRVVTATFQEPGVYNISLKVKDYMGCSASEVRQLVVFNDPLLGNSEQLKKYFSIYPNPANQFIHLKGEGNFNYDYLKIIDTKGREYFRQQNNKPKQQVEVISTSELKNGPYFLVLKKGKNEASFMFVISR